MVRLFMSIDMVGSTLFKGRGTGWLEVFQTFFKNFPLVFAGAIAHEFFDDEDTPSVVVWKVMGDEVIFVCELMSAGEATGLVRALFTAMADYEARYMEELPLRLKGTAWVADFTAGNVALDIPELSSEAVTHNIDFIGPDIDLGFRLAKFARASSIILSLDLVDIVLASPNRGKVALYHIGREELKGVVFGRPYPIIWMRATEAEFTFMPWEIEQCALTAKAAAAFPTEDTALKATIADMNLYLKKLHGIKRKKIVLDGSTDTGN